MSGSRSVSGCWTCRIRRKKCDEAKPYCSSCTSRAIPCLGYSKQRPAWMQQAGASWQQILESEPAQALRRLAQQSYDDSRKRLEDDASSSTRNPGEISWRLSRPFQLPPRQEFDHIWWDSNMFPHVSSHSSEAQGMLNYLREVPNVRLLWRLPQATDETHLSIPDRGWLYQALQSNKALYDIAVSLGFSLEARSAVAENSNNHRLATDHAHHYYGRALRNLQPMIDDIASWPGDSSNDGILKKIHALAAVMHLITWELVNHVSGAWPMHLEAGGRILGLLQNQISTHGVTDADGITSLIQQPVSTEQWILLRSHATSFALLDLVSQSAYGPQIGRDNMFYNYIPLLQKGYIDTKEVMGVSATVWLAINEVINLELESMVGNHDSYSLLAAVFAIDQSLHTIIAEEKGNVQDNSSRITVIFALGALVYLHTVQPTGSAENLLPTNVTECLEEMEKLPTELFARLTWPFTLAGCMAKGQSEQSRFRTLVTRTRERRQDLGFTWKGLLIMEECWKLRERRSGVWTWRSASEELGERVLLI